MIEIGVHLGGPELKDTPIDRALIAAMRIAMNMREAGYDDGNEAWINPIFIVPGSIWKPEFAGYKLGHFSRKQKGLVVQIEVPRAAADGEGMKEFIGEALREAVRLAAAFFAAKNIGFSTLKAEKVILGIERRLADEAAF